MTLELFLMGLMVCSLATGLVTEAIKNMLKGTNKTYRSNILAAVCSVVVAVIAVIAYTLITGTAITVPYITSCVLLTILSWLCAMVGYDKVMQTIEQVITKK